MGCRLKENPESLYVAFFEVAAPADKKSGPQIVSQYPTDFNDVGVTKELPKFCFPCDLNRYDIAGQFFTFVLTGLDNKQRYGFCRHPPGAAKCLCILSYLPWFDIFYKILNQLAELKNQDHDAIAQELLIKLHTTEVPKAHEQIKITVEDATTPVEVNIKGPDSRALPTMSGDRNISEYYNAVNDTNMMILFVSLLYERRILITSNKLSRLTACVHSAASLLCPLYWQHIYIPVMPAHLIDYCCAPMPFLVGVHSSFMPQVRKMALDEVVILNVDNNSIETPFEDLQTLPPEAVYQLKKNLKNSSLFYEDTLARSFLKVMVYLLGGYREAIRFSPNNELRFDQDIFVQCRSSHMQPFLEKLLQLQHFTQFVDSRVQMLSAGKPIKDLFEEELKTANLDDSLSGKNLKDVLKFHLTTVKTDSKKILKDVQKNVQQKANPEAMKLKLRQGRDFANKQLIGMKTKLIKGKETEDLDIRRHTTLNISLPLQAPSSAPTSPSGSPHASPVSPRMSMDVRRQKTSADSPAWMVGEKARPLTMAGMPFQGVLPPQRQTSDSGRPSSAPRLKVDCPVTEPESQGMPPSNMNLLEDLQEALQMIGSEKVPSTQVKRNSVEAAPVPMPRRRREQRSAPSPSTNLQRPLIPPPPVPPRRERHGSAERLIDIGGGGEAAGTVRHQQQQQQGGVVRSTLGVDCEDHALAFRSVHANNNAQAELPRNSSAQTLLADYGLDFGGAAAAAAAAGTVTTANSNPSAEQAASLRATCSSPNLGSYGSSPPRHEQQQQQLQQHGVIQEVFVQQPPVSTLPDLLSPANSVLPHPSSSSGGGTHLAPATSPSLTTTAAAATAVKAPASTNPFLMQHTPLRPTAASENPFQPAPTSDPKDPFADLVSFQREGVTGQTWKK